MHKLLLGTLLALSSTAYSYDTLQEAILNTDYEAVAQQYNAQEIPENLQHAYWSIAHDTAKMRSANVAFDWAKALVSKKLIISLLVLNSSWRLYNWIYRDIYYNQFHVGYAHLITNSVAWVCLLSAMYDGNKYYQQLQDKIKDAERIKFLIMNS